MFFMKKHYFRLFSFLLIFTLFFNITVFAGKSTVPPVMYKNKEFGPFASQAMTIDRFTRDILKLFDQFTGFLPDVAQTSMASNFEDTLRFWLEETGREFPAWLEENYLVDSTDSEYYLSDELISYMKRYAEQRKSELDAESPYSYYQTFTPTLNADQFMNYKRFSNAINHLTDLCNQYDYVLAFAPRNNRSFGHEVRFLVCAGLPVSMCGVVDNATSAKTVYYEWTNSSTDNHRNKYPTDGSWGNVFISVLDCETGLKYNFSSMSSFRNNSQDVIPGWIDNAYEQDVNTTICLEVEPDYKGQYSFYIYSQYFNSAVFNSVGTSGIFYPNIDGQACIFSKDGQYMPVYKTLNDLKRFQTGTIRQPYFSHEPTASGNSVTASALNNGITYGDIIGGNKYVITPGPGNPVSPVLPNPGGGGGGSDPSPNPGGGSGGGWNLPIPDFTGFFKVIGELIVSILSGIVELLKTVLQYLSTAITDLFSMINQIINSLLNLFNSNVLTFLQTVLAWLPPEITQLITLFITLSIVFGIVRLIRG